MFWSNVTEKGPKSALKLYYALKLAWKHQFLIILCSFRRINSKVNNILKFWSQAMAVLYLKPCCKEQCYNGSPVYIALILTLEIPYLHQCLDCFKQCK